jgi:hypothetical protein
VPAFPPPAAVLPSLPPLPSPISPTGAVAIAAVPDAPSSVAAVGCLPESIAQGESAGRGVSAVAGVMIAILDNGRAPARAPPAFPVDSPPHPGPNGGTAHSNRASSSGFLPAGVDDAARRAGLLARARSYASIWLLEPLLRPD